MKLIDRHLNWIVIVGGIGAVVCSCVFDMLKFGILSQPWGPLAFVLKIVAFPVYQVYPPIWAGWYIGGSAYRLTWAVTWAIPLAACAWVLHRKAQSLWWLLVSWIPYAGWVVPIVLKNRRCPSPLTDGERIGEPAEARDRSSSGRQALGAGLGGAAIGFAIWGGLSSAFFDFIILVVAPESEIVRHEMGLVWFIGLSATMVILLVGVILGGASLGLLRSCGDSVSRRRLLAKTALGICTALMAVNVFASWVAGTLPYIGLTGP